MSNARILHWRDGVYFLGSGDRFGEVFNPATGEVSAKVSLATEGDVSEIVASAARAFTSWSAVSLARRQEILFKYRELLNARKAELAEIITRENGKVLTDAMGEIARGLEVLDFATGLAHHLKGSYSEMVSSGVDVYSLRQPLGVVAVITPFNFPAMVPMWFFPIAIAAGNSVVLKPSEKVPSAALWLAQLFSEAGLPAGVFNVVNGDSEAVTALISHESIQAVSFVGSTPVAKHIYDTCSKNGKRVQALGGAKNHMLVLPDADLDLAADAAVNAGFGSAGERCMAISVLVAVEPIADKLVGKIAERISSLKVGDGFTNCDMGPLITAAHRDRVAGFIDTAAIDGASIVVDGRTSQFLGSEGGFWLGPTLIDKLPILSEAYRQEIFGPVLAVVRVASFNEGIELINASPYGNGSAIFTNDGGAARRFQSEVQAGMVGINVPIPVPVAYYSFGGWKSSIFGDTKAYGLQGVNFFTREKTVTSRWLNPSHGGVNLGFPQN